MSYLEFIGTLVNLLSVYLMTRRNILSWPIGIIAVFLFGLLFYQIRLYADFIEQIYYLGANLYGWWFWKQNSADAPQHQFDFSSKRTLFTVGILTILGGIIFGILIDNLNVLWPTWFPEAASYPYMDALTTVASFVAMILMAKKKIECWIYWIIINIVSCILYLEKDILFVALLYGVFLLLAISGLVSWMQIWRREAGAESKR